MQYRRYGKVNKYRNTKVEVNGIEFDSKKEARRYQELILLQRAGKVKDLQLQVKYELIPKQKGERSCSYIADFVYKNENGETIVEDTKGIRTPEYVIKRKLMLYIHKIKIKEV